MDNSPLEKEAQAQASAAGTQVELDPNRFVALDFSADLESAFNTENHPFREAAIQTNNGTVLDLNKISLENAKKVLGSADGYTHSCFLSVQVAILKLEQVKNQSGENFLSKGISINKVDGVFALKNGSERINPNTIRSKAKYDNSLSGIASGRVSEEDLNNLSPLAIAVADIQEKFGVPVDATPGPIFKKILISELKNELEKASIAKLTEETNKLTPVKPVTIVTTLEHQPNAENPQPTEEKTNKVGSKANEEVLANEENLKENAVKNEETKVSTIVTLKEQQGLIGKFDQPLHIEPTHNLKEKKQVSTIQTVREYKKRLGQPLPRRSAESPIDIATIKVNNAEVSQVQDLKGPQGIETEQPLGKNGSLSLDKDSPIFNNLNQKQIAEKLAGNFVAFTEGPGNDSNPKNVINALNKLQSEAPGLYNGMLGALKDSIGTDSSDFAITNQFNKLSRVDEYLPTLDKDLKAALMLNFNASLAELASLPDLITDQSSEIAPGSLDNLDPEKLLTENFTDMSTLADSIKSYQNINRLKGEGKIVEQLVSELSYEELSNLREKFNLKDAFFLRKQIGKESFERISQMVDNAKSALVSSQAVQETPQEKLEAGLEADISRKILAFTNLSFPKSFISSHIDSPENKELLPSKNKNTESFLIPSPDLDPKTIANELSSTLKQGFDGEYFGQAILELVKDMSETNGKLSLFNTAYNPRVGRGATRAENNFLNVLESNGVDKEILTSIKNIIEEDAPTTAKSTSLSTHPARRRKS